jgi:orotidine-5'-phosphate decarboxylase
MSSKEMLKEAVRAAKEINDKLFICAVTVLTTTNNLEDIGIKNSLEDQVKLLVNLAKSCGVQGVISSAQNIKLIRSLAGENFKLICPGIREKNKEQNDQKQTVSYKQFNQLANKNTFCVIGRPIYAYGDPEENIKNIINS